MTQDFGKRGRGRPKKQPKSPGEKPDLTENQWLALKKEFVGCGARWKNEGWPSSTSAQIVADFAGVSPQIVFRWRKNPEYLRGLEWLLMERLLRRLDRDCQSDSQPIAKHELEPDEFWVEPDPSLFKGDSQREIEMAAGAWIEMAAGAWIEMLGEDALNTATSRAAEFQWKGTADQRKLWTRLAHAIQELLDRRSDNETREKAVKN